MLDLREVMSNKIESNLISINYNLITETDASEECELEYYDSVELKEKGDNQVSFIVTRNVVFIPESFFNIKIAFSIERYLKEEYIGKIKLSDYDLLSEFKVDSFLFTKLEESWVSLLISQITSAFGNSPLITPPTISLKED